MYGIILYGLPCSGKSTIGKMYAKKYDCAYISSGDIARRIASIYPNVARDLKSGKFAPENMMRMHMGIQISIRVTHNKSFVLDGFPRFKDQEEWLLENFPDVKFIRVEINTTPDEARRRAKNRGRDDDESILDRIDYYNNTTFPELVEGKCSITVGDRWLHRTESVLKLINMEATKNVDSSKGRPVRSY